VSPRSGVDLAALIRFSLGPAESYAVVSSRYDLLRLAAEEGIRIPQTAHIESESDLQSWQASVHPWPMVLKADGTSGGRGVRVARNAEEAVQFFRKMSRPHSLLRVIKRTVVNRDAFWLRPWLDRTRPSVIAQAFVPGRPANCALFCWEGQVL